MLSQKNQQKIAKTMYCLIYKTVPLKFQFNSPRAISFYENVYELESYTFIKPLAINVDVVGTRMHR